MITSLVRDILCFTPLALILPAVLENADPGSGINGVLFAAPISDIVALVVILDLTVPFFKKIKHQESL
jgi:Na+-driven multidrug efflux pump